METHIIITDHIGARGMEFKQLIVSLDPNENCLHQYLVEAFTRCIDQLYFTIISKEVHAKKKVKAICRYIIRGWEERKLVEKQVVNICISHPSENHTLDSWCGSDGIYNIHQWHKGIKTAKDADHIEEGSIDMKSFMLQFKM